jgi:hypothetical protein
MKNASFLVTEGIPGVAAKGEIIKVSDGGILIGRWLSISKYPKLMESRDSLRSPSSSGVWISKRMRRSKPRGHSTLTLDTE